MCLTKHTSTLKTNWRAESKFHFNFVALPPSDIYNHSTVIVLSSVAIGVNSVPLAPTTIYHHWLRFCACAEIIYNNCTVLPIHYFYCINKYFKELLI
nr:MAG TPA: Fragile X mental retardation Tudor domain [Caudoviricetes sp.]